VLLRASGTEPKIRVMVEGQDLEEVKSYANLIAEKVKEAA
jgi:phosphoglucosamine mutase